MGHQLAKRARRLLQDAGVALADARQIEADDKAMREEIKRYEQQARQQLERLYRQRSARHGVAR